jgi:Zn-finger nucleic acid-binding protein
MLIVCQHCNGKLNSKIRFCPHCGGENIKKATKTILTCPNCNSPLEESEYRGSKIDLCPKCEGLWLDTSEFDFHSSERDTFSDDTIPKTYLKPPLPEREGYIKCIQCNAVMVKKNFRQISGVIIDFCRDHGVWLDAGELEKIRCFIANGGLDKSQDKSILKNKLEISRVAGEVKDLKTCFKIINKFNIKRILFQGF